MSELIEGSLKYARTSERVAAAMANVASTAETLNGILKVTETDLLPELRAALDALMEANDALKRAHKTAGVQWDVRLAKLRERLNVEGMGAL